MGDFQASVDSSIHMSLIPFSFLPLRHTTLSFLITLITSLILSREVCGSSLSAPSIFETNSSTSTVRWSWYNCSQYDLQLSKIPWYPIQLKHRRSQFSILSLIEFNVFLNFIIGPIYKSLTVSAATLLYYSFQPLVFIGAFGLSVLLYYQQCTLAALARLHVD